MGLHRNDPGRPPVSSGVLDPAYSALVADPRMAMRRLRSSQCINVVREAANAFMAREVGPKLWRVCDRTIATDAGGLTLRLYEPSSGADRPFVLFSHGGGFILGDLASHDGLCRRLAAVSGLPVAAIDYRLAPEAPFPAALDDGMAALGWLRDNAQWLGLDPDRWAAAGDSAGGQIALAIALRAAEAGFGASHAALLYPMLDPTRSSASSRELGEGYMLTGSFVEWAWECYAGGIERLGDPFFDLRLAELSALPPVRLVTAEFDPLRDEGEAFAKAVEAIGGRCEVRRYPGVIHGFVTIPPQTAQAGEALAYLAEGLRASLLGALSI